MEVWQLLLLKGNDSFNKLDLPLAEEYYHQAIECLEQQWCADIEDSNLLMAWISAFHNLAVLYEQQGQPKMAFRYLQIPHQRMYELSQEPQNSDDLKFVALHTLKLTLMPLLAFSKKYPACNGCLSSLKKMEIAVNANQPIIH
jgi:tetratricopeptide (TPR) repeat protein